MGENKTESGGVVELDLKRIADKLFHRLWLIILLSVLGAVIAFAFTYFFITPMYESSAMFYVNNNDLSVGDTSLSISTGDITASKSLVDSYIVILNTRTTLNDVIDYSGVSLSYAELRNMISAASVNSTEIFEIVVTSSDPYEAERLANAIAYVLPKRISSIVEGTSAKIVDTAIVAASPSSPSFSKNTILGFVISMLLCIAVMVLRILFDTTIRSEEMLSQITKHPILASVPNMLASSKGKYYTYDKQKRKIGVAMSHITGLLLGEQISFVAAESYKLLRTKLSFSFADESSSHVIGLSSAMPGEGKSLTAVNLAYSLSQLNKKVVLIDCDMRRPTLAEKLRLRKTPGLSSCLTGQEELQSLLQKCNIPEAREAFDVISAGQNPPNPIELLSSERMQKTLLQLRSFYDYIILDLPPVGEVSDALAVANRVDGMLLIVRQDYCNRHAILNTIEQFEFIDSKILGIVYNCASESNGRYGYKKKYYKRYGERYYGKYANRYNTHSSDVKK